MRIAWNLYLRTENLRRGLRMPSSAENDISAGEQALGQLDYDAAYKHFDKATKADPTNAVAFFGKAEAALGVPKVEPEEILGLYKKAIDLDGEKPHLQDPDLSGAAGVRRGRVAGCVGRPRVVRSWHRI